MEPDAPTAATRGQPTTTNTKRKEKMIKTWCRQTDPADSRKIEVRGTIPSKLAAVMASGLPIICAVNGDTASVVAQAAAGWTCLAEDVA